MLIAIIGQERDFAKAATRNELPNPLVLIGEVSSRQAGSILIASSHWYLRVSKSAIATEVGHDFLSCLEFSSSRERNGVLVGLPDKTFTIRKLKARTPPKTFASL